MKTVLEISIGKFFTIIGELGKVDFLRIDEYKYEGMNGRCVKSQNGTYEKGKDYYIQHDQKVIPTINFD